MNDKEFNTQWQDNAELQGYYLLQLGLYLSGVQSLAKAAEILGVSQELVDELAVFIYKFPEARKG